MNNSLIKNIFVFENYPMKYLYLLTFLFLPLFVVAQVGIGTSMPDPSAMLDVSSTDKGVLIPRLTSGERDLIVAPANGLMIYNTDADEIQFNSNNPTTPIWQALSPSPVAAPSIGDSVKYSSTDVTTNINTAAAIVAPLFGTLNWNDNTGLYTVSGNQVTITQTGRYEVIVNASLLNINGVDRNAPEIRIELDGTGVGAFGSTGYIRSNNGHEESSLHLREVIEVTANQVLTISISRSANTDVVRFRSAGTSNIYIEKIL